LDDYLHPGGDDEEGVAVASRWGRRRGNKTPVGATWMLTSYWVDKVRIDKGSVRYGRTNKRGGEHKCVASGVWNAAYLAGEGPIFRPHVQE